MRKPRHVTRVSVIIPSWNGEAHLRVCLDALSRQTFDGFETIVVDNGSDDGSVSYLRDWWPAVRLICLSENVGFPAAVNVGIRASTAEYVVLLNNDTRAEPEWLARLVAAMDENQRFSYGSSKLLRWQEPNLLDSAGHRYSVWRCAALNVGDGEPADAYSRPAPIFGASAAAAIYRRSLFEDIGLFDEDFFLVHEDVDFDLRANVAGHRCLFIHDAVVVHHRGGSFAVSPRIHLIGVRNRLWAVTTNLPIPLVVVAAVTSAVRALSLLVPIPLASRLALPDSTSWTGVGVRDLLRVVATAARAVPKKRAATRHLRRTGTLRVARLLVGRD
jgi:GT2 family glycosyltransferase